MWGKLDKILNASIEVNMGWIGFFTFIISIIVLPLIGALVIIHLNN